MNTNDATRVTAETMPENIDLNDIQSDVWHLYHLLDTTVRCILEMSFIRDGQRDLELERISALTWIARESAQQIGKDIDDNFYAIQRGDAK